MKTSHLHFLFKNCLFAIFVILCNIFFVDLRQAVTIGVRLGIIIELTYIISHLVSPQQFCHGIALLCAPLRILHVDVAALSLSLTLVLTFVPLLLRDARNIQASLRLKGCTFRTLLSRPQVYISGFINQLFNHLDAFEQALRLKGYE